MQHPIRIELPTMFEMRTVNAYLFTEPEVILVDCGENTPDTQKALEAGLAEHGLNISDIQKVVITHAHLDHIGQAGRIARASGAEVWVSDLVYDWAVNTEEKWRGRLEFIHRNFAQYGVPTQIHQGVVQFMRKFLEYWESVPATQARRFPIDGTLEMGGQTWQTIYAPGHCVNQTCFYAPKTQDFLAADMLLARTPVVVTERDPDQPQTRIRGLIQMLDSFDKIYEMDIDWVYPGHGEPFQDHRSLIHGQKQRIESRARQCYELIRQGHHTMMDLAQELYPGTFKPFNFPGFAMAMGYVDLLVYEGKIQEEQKEGKYYYTALD